MTISTDTRIRPLTTGTARDPFIPDAFILGAPKCGTTALASFLGSHPDIIVCDPKEPHYHATDLPGLRLTRSNADYAGMFKADGKHPAPLRLDASIWSLYSETAAGNIISRHPGARLIVMLRNPIEAAPSLHRQLLNALDEDAEDFEEAWTLQNERSRGRCIPASCRTPQTLLYGPALSFGRQLERLFEIASRDQVFVALHADLQADPAKTYRDVLAFLGVAQDGRTTFERVNERAKIRSRFVQRLVNRPNPIKDRIAGAIKKITGRDSLGVSAALGRLNKAGTNAQPLSPAMRHRLTAYFRPDILLLQDILGRDLSAWLGD